MNVVRTLGMIFLAVYLFFRGLPMVTGMQMPAMGDTLIGLFGMGAGVLILIAMGCKDKKK